MVDDDLEVIDLSDEDGEGTSRPWTTFKPSRRQITAAVVAAVLVAVAGIAFARHGSGAEPTAASVVPPTTKVAPTDPASAPDATVPPPQPIAGIVPGQLVEIAGGSPILVGQDGGTQRLLPDIPGNALVDYTQSGDALISYHDSTVRVIADSTFDGTRDPLPAGFELLPDADGRWWSNFGEIEGAPGAQQVPRPTATIAVAKLLDGYLVVDRAHTALIEQRSDGHRLIVGSGSVRVLAVAADRVAFAVSNGSLVRVADLTTGTTTAIASGGYAITARFSPDRSRLAILTSGSTDSMVLADTARGRVIRRVETAKGGHGLDVFPNLPPAFEPAPFGWDSTGTLVVISSTSDGSLVEALNARDGSALLTVAAPVGLAQAVPLLP